LRPKKKPKQRRHAQTQRLLAALSSKS